MKKVLSTLSAALFINMGIFAQQLDWEASPVLHKVKPIFEKESAVILTDQRLIQYLPDTKAVLMIQIDEHRLIKVLDDKGVEIYNKIYISMAVNAEVIEIKARTIQPGGKVVNLPESKILDVEEEGRRYKKFALEGVEKGSEVEYIYRIKKPISFFGTEVFNASGPIEKADFILSVPQHLVFSVKGYNGMRTTRDTVIGEKRITTATCTDIPKMEDEKYASTAPWVKNVQYKLSYNLSKEKDVRLFTWNELAKNLFASYNDLTDKEMKAVETLILQLKISEGASDEERIVVVEDFFKSNFSVDKNADGEDAERLDKIIKTKICNNRGMYKLFIATLKKINIRYQVVFPSKRDDLSLDENLENYRLIDDNLLYFPSTDNFLEPLNQGMRYPYVEPYMAATRGLFLKSTTLGTFTSALASFDSIPIQPYEKSAHDMQVKLAFNAAMDSLELHSKQILYGYGAMSYRPAYIYLAKEKIADFNKNIIKSVAKSENIRNIKVENTSMTDGLANKPLTFEADITTTDMMEMAGNRILVKLGEVIGPQEQMYQEKPRQLPILIQYPHRLDREITFTIPTGYKVKNLSDLNIDIREKTTGKETMGFVSSYNESGNDIHIMVHEFYKVVDYPVSMFDEFRKVINASADFNKVVLVLEKK